jgi:hypothetical protein
VEQIPYARCLQCQTNQHSFDTASNLSCFLGLQWIWHLPLRCSLLHLRVISINLRFITSNDGEDEVEVIFGLFLKLRADSNVVFLLVIAQQPGHTNVAPMRRMLSSSNKLRWYIPYDSLTMSQTLWIIRLQSSRIASRTLPHFWSWFLSKVVQNAHHRQLTCLFFLNA